MGITHYLILILSLWSHQVAGIVNIPSEKVEIFPGGGFQGIEGIISLWGQWKPDFNLKKGKFQSQTQKPIPLHDYSPEVDEFSTEETDDDEASEDSQLTSASVFGSGKGVREVTKDESCKCGFKKNADKKIVGGSLAKENAWPWMAALVFYRNGMPNVFCGGSLINSQYVLTAAHCVEEIVKNGVGSFGVLLGTNIITSSSDSNVTSASIAQVLTYPDYDKETLNNDMALIKLAGPVALSERVTPICLSQNGAPYSNRGAIVAGWGALSSSSNPVNKLRNVQVKVLRNNVCNTLYRKVRIAITQVMLCATGQRKDACRGDSGGPLFVRRSKNGQVYDQIGVVSFGQDCADPNFPGVYARVGRFMRWIKDNTKDAAYCSRSA